MNQDSQTVIKFNDSEKINIRQILDKYLHFWIWFVLGVLVSTSIAHLHLKYTTPLYFASTSILIKDNQKSGISKELEAFKDLGIIGGSSSNNPINEIEIIKSRKIIGKVVDILDLNIFYFVSGRIKEYEAYTNSPIKISFIDKNLTNNLNTHFYVLIKKYNSYDLLDSDERLISSHNYNDIVNNLYGSFTIEKNPLSSSNVKKIKVKIIPKKAAISSYRSKIQISEIDQQASVLNISLKDVLVKKAEIVLDELVNQYNLDAINDKNQVSEKTKEFIDNRLNKVQADLYEIDNKVKKFKDDKNFTGIPAELDLAFESLKQTNTMINSARTQLSLIKWIEEMLTEESSTEQLLPSSIGFEDDGLALAIANYNELILVREKTAVNAGPQNPVVKEIESRIVNSTSNLLKSLSSIKKSLEIQLKDLNNESDKILTVVKSIPGNERGFIDIAREQEIIGSLYQYLLKKKEETDISLAVTVPNAKIIDQAYGSQNPVYPNKNAIYLLAVILGILAPFSVIFLVDILNTKIHNKKDLDDYLSIPFLGDIPRSDKQKKIIAGHDERTSSAEAFRLIRTNLDFLLVNNIKKRNKTILVTSTTSGEGKSFISINLAATIALSGEKVCLVGMDLRAPKITEYLNIYNDNPGVTHFIKNQKLNIEDLVFNIPQIKGLDIISSGVIPPNPTELLNTDRVNEFFQSLQKQYDIIILDTAPINLVTDTLMISKYADAFIYVVRANYLDKRMLSVPQELYKEEKLQNMAIVLNDTDYRRIYGYGGYGYGYGGYGYGYGGYGYGTYGEVKKISWFKKIIGKKI